MFHELEAAQVRRVADFLDASTLVHRWLVALFRRWEEVSGGGVAHFGFWVEAAGRRDGEVTALLAHCFGTGVTYLAARAGFGAAAVEALLEAEARPERLVGDAGPLREWEERSPGFFARARSRDELLVLAVHPGGIDPLQLPASGFRAAVPADVERLTELERLRAREQADESLEEDLPDLIARELVFVLEEEQAVVGMARSNLPDGRYVHLGGVYVHPAWRRRGVASRLVAGLSRRIHQSGHSALLDVSRSNLGAVAAYRQVGFRHLGEGVVLRFPEDAFRTRS